MLTLNKLIPQGRSLAAVLLKRASHIELDWDTRQKSRFDATDSAGRHLGVFLARGSVVRGGDVLVAEDGSLVRVIAAPQPVLVVQACSQHGSPFDLLRAAYHLGNRHAPLELQPDRLQLEPDHVLADMLRQMHLIVTEAHTAFEPESGAYASGGHGHAHGAQGHGHDHGAAKAEAAAPAAGHGHDHAHDHAHDHQHGHSHDHGHAHGHDHAAPAAARGKAVAIPVRSAAPAPHVHGPGCGHDHGDHGHSH